MNGKCPMFETCQHKTAVCSCKLPDESCFWYRWFKERIEEEEDSDTTFNSVEDGVLYANGEEIPWPKPKRSFHSIYQIDGKLFVDGYEWRDGRWKRTLASFIRGFF